MFRHSGSECGLKCAQFESSAREHQAALQGEGEWVGLWRSKQGGRNGKRNRGAGHPLRKGDKGSLPGVRHTQPLEAFLYYAGSPADCLGPAGRPGNDLYQALFGRVCVSAFQGVSGIPSGHHGRGTGDNIHLAAAAQGCPVPAECGD